MWKKALVPVFLTGVIGIGVADQVAPTTKAGADSGKNGQTTAVAHAASSTSQTAKVVKAANAFLATLSSSQKAAVLYSFNDTKKQSGWSNLPTSLVKRNGIKIGDLSSKQGAALKKLLVASLSSTGYKTEQAIRTADSYLASLQGSGGGGMGLSYGSTLYYVSFFGTPSTSGKWTFQFGGHHLAINLTYAGSEISGTPYFVGVEPGTGFTYASKSYDPMSANKTSMVNLFKSLSSSQLASAKLSTSFDDVLVGPGKDGQFPTRQGVSVSSLSTSQQALVTKAISAWVNNGVDAATAKKTLAAYKAGYSKTKIAWSKSIDLTTQGSYLRIDGPRVWIEIVAQNGIVIQGKIHYHSIWRDRSTDYGA